MLVEREIGDEPLQARILILELAHPAHLVHAKVAVALLPDAERRLADPELPTDIADRRPGFCLPARVRHLLLGELRPLHLLPPRVVEDG